MLPIHEAVERIVAGFEPVGVERVSLAEAHGRFAAADVRARRDLPPFDNSAMDGYAVRADEVAEASPEAPIALPVRGESRAGGPLPEALAPGTAMRIFTGAPLPDGADAIVIQEDTERDGDRVRIFAASAVGKHVRGRGTDLSADTVMLRDHAAIDAGEIALLASQGHASVTVYRRPLVALLSTGDELREVGDPPEPGTIVSSNAHALAALVRAAGAVPRLLPIARDEVNEVTRLLEDALTSDVVLSTGGVSVGEYDFVHEAFRRAGVEADFWKVRIKPGKPVAFGRRGRVPVVGLPGNPVSAQVTFEVFVRPGLRRMLGDPRPHPVPITAQLAHSHRRKPGRTEMARARIRVEGGRLVAELHHLQGSGSIPSLVDVDALVVLPADRDVFEEGETVEALPVRRLGQAISPFGGQE